MRIVKVYNPASPADADRLRLEERAQAVEWALGDIVAHFRILGEDAGRSVAIQRDRTLALEYITETLEARGLTPWEGE